MPHRPTIYGLGSGPTLLEHIAAWADGLAVTCPPAWPNVERFAAEREKLLNRVAEHGRDPDAFRFAVWFPVLLADDHEQLLEALQNPILKWLSAFFGRIDNHLWKDEGMVAPMPEDWVYYKDFLPYRTSAQFIDDALATVTPEHAFKAWLAGTPEDVAAQIQPYVDAGADWVCPMDYVPMILEPEAAQAAFGRSIDLCHRIRCGSA